MLQGEVEQISLMDAQQLLSYLSEIIGTHEYEELLAEQAKKCDCVPCWLVLEPVNLMTMLNANADQQRFTRFDLFMLGSECVSRWCLPRLEELTEVRQSAMNRAKAADKKVAATAGPAAITQAYNAKRAELAGAEDTKLQLYIRTGEVRRSKSSHR